MNRRLEGWRLILAVLVPAVIIALAIWFLIQLVGGTDDVALETAAEPTVTPVPTSAAQSIADLPDPTPIPAPTPIALPSPVAIAQPTAVPVEVEDSEPEPARPATSAPSNPQPSGPAPTPTPDPDALAITCAGLDFPVRIQPGESISGLSAQVNPAESADGFSFIWDLGNGRVAGAPNIGTATYENAGRYTIALKATDRVTQEVIEVTCGVVRVGGSGSDAPQELAVSCQVRPRQAELVKWEEATLDDEMRVTVSWVPKDTILNLRYEFPIPEPLYFENGASSPDRRNHFFATTNDVVRVWFEDPETRERGTIECPAYSDEPLIGTYNTAGNP